MAEKKFGSVKDIPKKKTKTSFWDKFWNYKPYIIGAVIVVLGGLLMLMVFRGNMQRAATPAPSPSITAAAENDSGKLVVLTEPSGASVNIHGQNQKSPATFNQLPEGTYIAVVNLYGYHPISQEVKVEKSKIKRLMLKLEKLGETPKQ